MPFPGDGEPIESPWLSVAITSPTANTTISGNSPAVSVTVKGTVSYDFATVDGVYVRLGTGGAWQLATGISPWSFTGWVSQPGTLQISASAQGAADDGTELSDVASRNVTVSINDITGPSLSITSPANNASFSGDGRVTQVPVTISTSDALSGISKITWSVDGTPDSAKTKTFGPEILPQSWTGTETFDIPASSKTSHVVTVQAIDGRGNATAQSVTVLDIDRTAPFVDVLEPLDGAKIPGKSTGTSVTVRGTAEDRQSGVSLVEWSLNNGTFSAATQTVTGTWSQWQANVAVPTYGLHTITVRFKDKAGNSNAKPPIQIEVARAYKPKDTDDLLSPRAYLEDLLWFANTHVTAAGAPLTVNQVVQVFAQPFDRLVDPLAELGNQPVNQLRIAIEVLRRYLGLDAGQLAAHWRFDEGSGTTTADTSGNGNTATLRGPLWDVGKVGKALRFDGVDDYVETGLDVQPSAMPSTTWAAWVYPTGINHSIRQNILSTDDGGYDRGVIVEAGTAKFGVYTGKGAWYPTSVSLNEWQHIAVVYTPDDVYFYKNGVAYREGTPPTGQATANKLTLGKNPGYNEPFQGLLDDVRIYRHSLGPRDIALLAGFTPALVAHWTFDEGYGSTTVDTTTSRLAAAITGAAWTSGRSGNALAFDGVDDMLTVASAPALEVGKNNGDFSVVLSILLRANGTGQSRSLIRKGNTDAERTFAIWLHPSNNRVHYRISTTAGTNEGGDSIAQIPLNTWTNVAYVKAGNKLRLFINGRLDSEATLAGTSVSNTGPLYIGKSPWAGGSNVILDDLRIYTWALAPVEVAALAADLAGAERTYAQAAYQALLNRIGTSYEEIRLARGAPDATRKALAARLGINLDATPRDQLEHLLLPPEQITQPALEQLFGLLDTTRSPFQAAPTPQFLTWQQQYLQSLWKHQDHPELPEVGDPSPIIDPDVIGLADLASPVQGNAAYDRWKARSTMLSTSYATLKSRSQGAPLAGFDTIVADTLRQPATILQTLAARDEQGVDITADLETLFLTPPAFRQLLRVRRLAASSGTVTSAEWEDVYNILVQVEKLRAAPTWRSEERNLQITLTPNTFKLVESPWSPPPWRAARDARRQWQDKLQARIDQARTLEEGLRSNVSAVEEVTLPLLRDGLVSTVATLHQRPDAAEWLTDQLLIDVRGSGFQKTTRLLQAIETLQGALFSLRTGRFDPSHPADAWAILDGEAHFDDEWKWLGSHATWRAAMLVFFYPENLLLPNLREEREQTEAFRKLMQSVRARQRLTPSDAREVAAAYQSDLRDSYGRIAHWKFDEGKDGVVGDASGNGHTGTLTGALWTGGRSGGGLAFDGVDDGVKVNGTTLLEVGKNNGDFSVVLSILLRANGTGQWRSLIRKGNTDAERTFAIWLHPSNNRVHYRLSTTAGANEGGDSIAQIPLNTWAELAYVKAGNKLKLYINRVLDSEVTLSGAVLSNPGPLYISANPWSPGVNAIIDEVRIYDWAAVAEPWVLSDQVTDVELGRRRDLARMLLQPWVDTASTPDRLRPTTPAHLRELFYYVPMQLALQLQKSGEYVAALDWFQTVYAYNLTNLGNTAIDERKIYPALDLEQNIPPDLSRTTHWLREWLNPHTLAASRPNPYTRYTLVSLARCFVDFADAEFTRDTGESLARARSLYLTARSLLLLPELQQPAAGLSDTILPNPVPDALRLRVDAQLSKLRQGRNIAGMKRQVETYAPPARAAGSLPTVGSGGQLVVPGTTTLRPTPYRYAVLIDRSKQLVNIAQQIEAAFLAALEKRDAANYDRLRAGFDLDLARAGEELQQLRVTESQNAIELARRQQARATIQQSTYQNWIEAGLNAWELSLIKDYETARDARNFAANLDYMITSAQAMITAATATYGAALAFAGVAIATAGAFGKAATTIEISNAETAAQIASVRASQARRQQEWELQRSLADQDYLIGQQQITIAQDHTAIVTKEQTIAQTQATQARAVADFLANKFTNAELYEWMSGILGGVYSYFLQQATAVARLAQNQLAFERQEVPPNFVQADYWQPPTDGAAGSSSSVKGSDRRGLTGSARLLQDIYQLDQYAFETDKRKLNLSQTFSLARLAPYEFQQFRETGVLPFATPMYLFDQSFAGHYLRLIKRVRASVIALIPPTQGIRATLTASGISRVVIGGDVFQEVVIRRDPELVALTSPNNATGLFELDTQGEMLLPFEAMGVDTTWEFEMPRAANSFDFRTIADVLITIEYTALNSFDYRQQVIQTLNLQTGGELSYSFRDQFADQWYELNNPDGSATPLTVQFTTTRADFPPNLEQLKVQQLMLYFARANGETAEIDVGHLHFVPSAGANGAPVGGRAISINGVISTARGNAPGWSTIRGRVPFGTWELHLA
ncbi:MAG TPA: LamG-like jellyroll fold domain-containing protein, partial [Herpetosiphonaceae bacterium]|nr:LamG-like jellyroll fold domain-containing protein [Herpetosiphonaceae bacterium]